MQPQSIAHAIKNFCEMTCRLKKGGARAPPCTPPAYRPDSLIYRPSLCKLVLGLIASGHLLHGKAARGHYNM